MTDEDVTKLCAEAMGVKQSWYPHGDRPTYDPLHDDAQAMALVKKFELQCGWYDSGVDEEPGRWCAAFYSGSINAKSWSDSLNSLNRAIVECVAKMQVEKKMAA